MARLTRAQARMLGAIVDYQDREGISPSIRDLGAALGLSSTSTVWYHLHELCKRGYISAQRSKPRSIQVMRDRFGEPCLSPMGQIDALRAQLEEAHQRIAQLEARLCG